MSAVDCASKRVSSTCDRASGPVFQCVFLVILDHSAVVFVGVLDIALSNDEKMRASEETAICKWD